MTRLRTWQWLRREPNWIEIAAWLAVLGVLAVVIAAVLIRPTN